MLPPPAPKDTRDRNDSERQTRRDISPHRPARSRNGSTESRASRVSASRRDTERRSRASGTNGLSRADDDARGRQAEELLGNNAKGSEGRRSDRDNRDRERDRDREADKRRDRARDRDHDARGEPKDRARERDDKQRGREIDKERMAKTTRQDSERARDRSGRDRESDRPRAPRERDDRRPDREPRVRDRDRRNRDRSRNRSRDSERPSKTASRETASDRQSDRARNGRERERERSPMRGSRRSKDRSGDTLRPKDAEHTQREEQNSRRNDDDRGNSRREAPSSSGTDRRDPQPHLDALANRFEDNRNRTPTRPAASGEIARTARLVDSGHAREEPHRSDVGPPSGSATPRLAERMGLSSRNGLPGGGAETLISTAAADRSRAQASAIESLTLRIDRDPPPHATTELKRDARDNPSDQIRVRDSPAAPRNQVRLTSSA